MAFTIEAALTVPLSMTLLLTGVTRIPPIIRTYRAQTVCLVESCKDRLTSDDLCSFAVEKHGGQEFLICFSNPQKMQDLVSLAHDLGQALE